MEYSAAYAGLNNLELARKCLMLIRDIADRGARSQNAEHLGYALQELTQVLVERTGNEDRLFEPVPPDEIQADDLQRLYAELDFVNSASENLAALALQRETGSTTCRDSRPKDVQGAPDVPSRHSG